MSWVQGICNQGESPSTKEKSEILSFGNIQFLQPEFNVKAFLANLRIDELKKFKFQLKTFPEFREDLQKSSCCEADDADGVKLADILIEKLPSQKLRLGSCSASIHQQSDFFLTLRMNQSLTCVDFLSNKLLDEGITLLCTMLLCTTLLCTMLKYPGGFLKSTLKVFPAKVSLLFKFLSPSPPPSTPPPVSLQIYLTRCKSGERFTLGHDLSVYHHGGEGIPADPFVSSLILVALGTAVCHALDPFVSSLILVALGTAVCHALDPFVSSLILAALGTAVCHALDPFVSSLILVALGTAVCHALDPFVSSLILVALGTAVCHALDPFVSLLILAALGTAVCHALDPFVSSLILVALGTAVCHALDPFVSLLILAALGTAVCHALDPFVSSLILVALGTAVCHALDPFVSTALPAILHCNKLLIWSRASGFWYTINTCPSQNSS
ncbi:hypothetical protein STEG23_015682 [Scotinomys teguina]